MKCQTHMERDSVGICEECKTPICHECNDNFGGLCMKCAEKEVADCRKEILITCGISVGFFIVALMYNINKGYMKTNAVGHIIMSIMFGFIPYGWKGISVITDKLIFLMRSGYGLLMYFVIKLIAAVTIGWILAIPKIISLVKRGKTCNILNHNLKTMKMIPSSRCANE